MVIKTDEECCTYVEGELNHLVQSQPGWHMTRSVAVPLRPLTWNLGRDAPAEAAWYTLEARMDRAEFLIWFGNHQVGAEGLHWIMRPAVHVAFGDLWPRGDQIAVRFTLGDVLRWMIASLAGPRRDVMRFAMNSASMT